MKWNEVTWYSKLGALILFIFVVPTLTFYIGRQYERTVEFLQRPPVLEQVVLPWAEKRATTTPTIEPTQKVSTSTEQQEIKPKSVSDSGIRGVVMLGPTCPVERIPPDPACADKPYTTIITIFPADDLLHAIALVHNDTQGAFTVTLAPGAYVLKAGQNMLPRCVHSEVTVTAHAYTTTTISCDSDFLW